MLRENQVVQHTRSILLNLLSLISTFSFHAIYNVLSYYILLQIRADLWLGQLQAVQVDHKQDKLPFQ